MNESSSFFMIACFKVGQGKKKNEVLEKYLIHN